MKKIFFSFLAIAALASCAKTEVVYVEDNSEIKLAPVTTHVTKANVLGSIDGTQYPAAEEFDVYAYWATDGAGSVFTTGATAYLGDPTTGAGVKFTKKGDWFWGGTTPYYWPKNGSLRFAAYSPASIEQAVMHDLATDTYTVDRYTQPNLTNETFDFLLAPTSVSYTAATAVDDVDVVFEHALSWITLQAKAADEAAAKAFTVHKVIINNVYTVADLKAEMPAKVWSNWDVPQPYVVNDAYDKVITEDVAVLDKVANGTVVIPQLPTTVTVKYTQNALEGTPALENQEVTVPLILDGNANWEPGKHYIYTLIFGLDEILITPSVVDWEDVEVPVIDATATEVNNAVDFISAVAAGRNVRLTSDIQLPQGVVVTKDVQVELNGKTLSYENTTDACTAVFEVRTGTLTLNGPGNVKALGNQNIAVWAGRGDAANDGKVIINGGDYSNASSQELIYAINKGTVEIYGGTFQCAEPATSFAELQYPVLNLYGNGATGCDIVVYGGSFMNFNPVDNVSENPRKNFVAAGHNVIKEGDWYTVYASEGAHIVLDEATTFVSSINVKNGTFDGAGNYLTVTDAPENPASTYYGLVCPEGDVTVSNLTINGGDFKTTDNQGLRGIYVTKAGNYVIDNVVVENVTYAINVNTTQPVTLAVKNSTLEGWTSYGSTTSASFENVAFTCGTYANFKPYTTVTLTGCSFAEGFMIDFTALNGVINFKNCTYNGIVLTAENFKDTVSQLDGYSSDKVAF